MVQAAYDLRCLAREAGILRRRVHQSDHQAHLKAGEVRWKLAACRVPEVRAGEGQRRKALLHLLGDLHAATARPHTLHEFRIMEARLSQSLRFDGADEGSSCRQGQCAGVDDGGTQQVCYSAPGDLASRRRLRKASLRVALLSSPPPPPRCFSGGHRGEHPGSMAGACSCSRNVCACSTSGQVQRQRANVCLLPELRWAAGHKGWHAKPMEATRFCFRLLLAARREGHCAGGRRAGASDGLVAWDDPATAGRDAWVYGPCLISFLMSGSRRPASPHRTPPALLLFPVDTGT